MVGGGSCKYAECIKNYFPNSKLICEQEFNSLRLGLIFLINY